ncbi:MAG TPA: polyprenyl synthetase family protein [Synergistaceae bacterium]|nr:polyprenyl synthetase family protein [Synergistaceae bacterium]
MSEFDAVRNTLAAQQKRVDRTLEDLCGPCPSGVPDRLWQSMRHSLLAGGKRLRPVLCMAGSELAGSTPERGLPMGIAFEMVHTASLIHDDLPCMDNDVLRRGLPTNHVLFGESLALLAGDALLAWAFSYPSSLLAQAGVPAERILRAMEIFAQAVGPWGICGGQVLDSDPLSLREGDDFLWDIARGKTATLIQGALLSGAILGGAGPEIEERTAEYGLHLGLAFQIVDDILDATAPVEELGKTPGKDATQGKRTFVTHFGLDQARSFAQRESDAARRALEGIPRGEWLRSLASYLVHRCS